MSDYQLILLTTVGILTATTIALLIVWIRSQKRARRLSDDLVKSRERLAGIADLDDEKARLRAEILEHELKLTGLQGVYDEKLAKAEKAHAAEILKHDQDIHNLRADYRRKKSIYDRMIAEIAIFDERLSFAEMGVYEPHFEFTDSQDYKTAISATRDLQKGMVERKTAVFCTQTWTVDGSTTKGQTMTNRGIRLTLRAFNNECDAAIANTRWNNVNAMEKRVLRAKDQVDKLNASNAIIISNDYLDLKLRELFLTHEYREKVKSEREERAEAARLAREEQRFLRDMEDAIEEEDRYARLLAKARAEADKIVGPQLDAFTQQIEVLERDLAEAHAKAERAQAMAERTRSGYVYIISNIGSFGEGVVKIGLTRRLDPLDRVRELGDASVPFVFDTHAIIYSDDAPGLERALHSEFESTRINMQNYRKEFFRAAIDEVEDAVKRLAPEAPFFRDVEAQEYRETLARRQHVLMGADEALIEQFPSEL